MMKKNIIKKALTRKNIKCKFDGIGRNGINVNNLWKQFSAFLYDISCKVNVDPKNDAHKKNLINNHTSNSN